MTILLLKQGGSNEKSTKIFICFLFCFILLVYAGALSAQSKKYGIGINVMDFFRNYDVFELIEQDISEVIKYPVLHGTIFTSQIRIEPELSYWRHSRSEEQKDIKTEKSEKMTILHIGIGVAPLLKKNSKTVSYLGVKTCIDFLSTKTESNEEIGGKYETKSKRTNFSIGPCFGTEYFVNNNLTLGGEFQIMYTSIGQQKTTFNGKNQDKNRKVSDSILKSKALVYLRWYF